jgi:hypothetical protein
MPTKSQAKLMMIKFLRDTRETPDFSFRIRGDLDDAKKFVHRMRVELSRMRDTVKDSGRVPKEFKVLMGELNFDFGEGITTIELKKSEGRTVEIAEDVQEIFDDLAGGERLQ